MERLWPWALPRSRPHRSAGGSEAWMSEWAGTPGPATRDTQPRRPDSGLRPGGRLAPVCEPGLPASLLSCGHLERRALVQQPLRQALPPLPRFPVPVPAPLPARRPLAPARDPPQLLLPRRRHLRRHPLLLRREEDLGLPPPPISVAPLPRPFSAQSRSSTAPRPSTPPIHNLQHTAAPAAPRGRAPAPRSARLSATSRVYMRGASRAGLPPGAVSGAAAWPRATLTPRHARPPPAPAPRTHGHRLAVSHHRPVNSALGRGVAAPATDLVLRRLQPPPALVQRGRLPPPHRLADPAHLQPRAKEAGQQGRVKKAVRMLGRRRY